jgi:hypothetical protein
MISYPTSPKHFTDVITPEDNMGAEVIFRISKKIKGIQSVMMLDP